MATRVTYGRVDELLNRLRFTSTVEATRGIRAYRHTGTRTLVLLAAKPEEAAVAEGDIVSLRRQLCERGILEPREFEAWLAAA